MTAAAVIDVPSLLVPISDDAPAGIDPRLNASPTSPYYKVKDARLAARAVERTNFDPDAPPPETWAAVLSVGQTVLAREAKDLEIAAWMCEALVRLEGFTGLRDGLRLVTGLVEGFWGHIYPLPDEDGMETRVAPVAGLNGSGAAGTLAQSIRTIPLVGVTRTFSIWSYDQALETDKLTDNDRKQARLAAGTPSMEMFRNGLAETAAGELYETLTTVDECLTSLAAMAAAFDAVAGYDAPPTSALRELLEHIASAIRFFGGDKIASQARAATQAEASSAADTLLPVPASGEATPAAAGGGIASARVYPTRDHALAAVLALAAYFRRTEPQAPISYTLEEAVRRAKMSLPELLRELTHDPSHTSRFLLAAGIRLDGDSRIEVVQPVAAATTSSTSTNTPSTGGW